MLWRKVTPPATKKHINQVIGRLLSVADGTTFEIVQPETLLGRVPDTPLATSVGISIGTSLWLSIGISAGVSNRSQSGTPVRGVGLTPHWFRYVHKRIDYHSLKTLDYNSPSKNLDS